jgi:hypothetical protein
MIYRFANLCVKWSFYLTAVYHLYDVVKKERRSCVGIKIPFPTLVFFLAPKKPLQSYG